MEFAIGLVVILLLLGVGRRQWRADVREKLADMQRHRRMRRQFRQD